MVKISSLILVVLFGIGYMVKTSSAVVNGYEADRLKKEKDILKEDLKSVEIKIAQKGSMENIQKRLADSDMVPVEKIVYHSSDEKFFAKK